jgi:hypothetical protein
MVTAAMAMIILASLAVDLGGRALTRQHVANVAAQCWAVCPPHLPETGA